MHKQLMGIKVFQCDCGDIYDHDEDCKDDEMQLQFTLHIEFYGPSHIPSLNICRRLQLNWSHFEYGFIARNIAMSEFCIFSETWLWPCWLTMVSTATNGASLQDTINSVDVWYSLFPFMNYYHSTMIKFSEMNSMSNKNSLHCFASSQSMLVSAATKRNNSISISTPRFICIT